MYAKGFQDIYGTYPTYLYRGYNKITKYHGHPIRDPITETENGFMEPKHFAEEVIVCPNHPLTFGDWIPIGHEIG